VFVLGTGEDKGEGMTLRELIKDLQRLQKLHGDITVVYSRYSDYGVMTPDEYCIMKASPVRGAAGKWMMRDSGLGRNCPVDTEEVLYFVGN
jgi:hypothetical protein